jgi:hypothetical protein
MWLRSEQIAVNDIAKFGSVVEGATTIAHIICRYAVFEDIYLLHTTAATHELERALVKLYSAIMIYLFKAKSYFDQNSASKYKRQCFASRS